MNDAKRASLVACFCLAAPLLASVAQDRTDRVIRAVFASDVAKILEGKGVKYEKVSEEVLRLAPCSCTIRAQHGNVVTLTATYSAIKPDPRRLSEYNGFEDFRGRVFAQQGTGILVYELTVPIEGGVTEEYLAKQIDWLLGVVPDIAEDFGAPARPAATRKYSEGIIIAELGALHSGMNDLGRLGLKRCTARLVGDYAAALVATHDSLAKDVAAVGERVAPSESWFVSIGGDRELADRGMQLLRSPAGADWDRRYVDFIIARLTLDAKQILTFDAPDLRSDIRALIARAIAALRGETARATALRSTLTAASEPASAACSRPGDSDAPVE